METISGETGTALCSMCQTIFSSYTPDDPPVTLLKQTILELEKSAQQGCSICLLRRRMLSEKELLSVDPAGLVTYQFSRMVWPCREDLLLSFSYPCQEGRAAKVKSIRMVSERRKFLLFQTLFSDMTYQTLQILKI